MIRVPAWYLRHINQPHRRTRLLYTLSPDRGQSVEDEGGMEGGVKQVQHIIYLVDAPTALCWRASATASATVECHLFLDLLLEPILRYV